MRTVAVYVLYSTSAHPRRPFVLFNDPLMSRILTPTLFLNTHTCLPSIFYSAQTSLMFFHALVPPSCG